MLSVIATLAAFLLMLAAACGLGVLLTRLLGFVFGRRAGDVAGGAAEVAWYAAVCHLFAGVFSRE